VVSNSRKHRINQRSAVLGPRRFNFRCKRGYGLLGTFEAHLTRLCAALGGGDSHDGAEQVVRQQVRQISL
jgi:hypothetical protein